jgi:predicted XRE-type DNA-binding protein
MKKEKLKPQSLESVASDWGIDYQVYLLKTKLINKIKEICEENGISQRKLAKMVEGLSQDRISKIFTGQVGHMTLDKLVEILSALKVKVDFKLKEVA